jgi:hypothetical protein
MMKLSSFKNVISNMPVSCQAFTSKWSTWQSHINRHGAAGDALTSIFDKSGEGEVTISRSDLRSLAGNPDLGQFVMATIIWGYPRGMRGNNVARLIGDFESLTSLLSSTVSEQSVVDWSSHYDEKVVPIGGIGLSTYTKFLSFLSIQVQGYPALILDDRIIRVSSQRLFEELAPLRKLNGNNAVALYPEYLECIHNLARSLDVSAEGIEFFLFEFGLNLKLPTSLQSASEGPPQAAVG